MITKARKLAKELCANYDLTGPTGTKNWCWPRDTVCRFYTGDDPERCGYFEEAVLPTDPGLQIAYSSYFGAVKVSQSEQAGPGPVITNRRQCKCGKTFTRKSNRQLLCEECSRAEKKKKSRERKRRQRMKKAV